MANGTSGVPSPGLAGVSVPSGLLATWNGCREQVRLGEGGGPGVGVGDEYPEHAGVRREDRIARSHRPGRQIPIWEVKDLERVSTLQREVGQSLF